MDIASAGVRVFGAIVDLIVIFLTFSAIGYATGMGPENGGIGFSFDVVYAPYVLALGFAYYIVPEALWGATPGKFLLAMRVVNEADGGKIDWMKSITRNLLRIIDGLPALYILGFIFAVTSPKVQRLGDRVAKTVVVRV
jgi:uncharacterized RDD family membrane protein YckC